MIGISVQTLNVGETALVTIDSLLELPYSLDYTIIDEDWYRDLHWFRNRAMHQVREDALYPGLVREMREVGAIERPVTVCFDTGAWFGSDPLVFCDGHHRLAAAVQLGWSSIAVTHCGQWDNPVSQPVADDSGSWGPDGFIDEIMTDLETKQAFRV